MASKTKTTFYTKFRHAMYDFDYFEDRPEIAIAVSGGSDSMALLLLAQKWALAHSGKVIALSVDHRLRKESYSELVQVGRWLKKINVAHHILTWRKKKNLAK